MNPMPSSKSTNPAATPVASRVPLVARRVQPPVAQTLEKPAETPHPTTLETVAKIVDGVSQIVGFAKKFFPAAPATPTVSTGFSVDPSSCFGPMATGIPWGAAPLPQMPVMPPMPMMPPMMGYDPSMMMGGFDPNSLMMGGFDPNMMMGFGIDPNSGW